jgi:hypothetical protein
MLIDSEIEVTRETIFINREEYVRESDSGYNTNARWYKVVSNSPRLLELVVGEARDTFEDYYIRKTS